MIRILVQADGDTLADGKGITAIEAITRLREAIAELQRRSAPVFDASFGEQPLPLIAPSEAELQTFIHR